MQNCVHAAGEFGFDCALGTVAYFEIIEIKLYKVKNVE